MSLVCLECDQDIEFGDALYVVTTNKDDRYSAVCPRCLNKLDLAGTHHESSESHSVALHAAESKKNFTGAYTWSDLQMRELLFFIPDEEIRKKLPKVAGIYFDETQ